MPLTEFNLIERYFAHKGSSRDDVSLSIGDDCALLNVPAGFELAVSIDTLIEDVHFPKGTRPEAIGHKSLAVGLSDLAAMGATPAWATLSLSLPEIDESWLQGFTTGLFGLAEKYQLQLVGGDTVRGPLVITVQVHGFVPEGLALKRSGAKPGDGIYVTGTLGDAGLGLLVAQGKSRANTKDANYLRRRLDCPTPCNEAGLSLRNIAGACIDISDGLAADLGHILKASGIGATLQVSQLPLSDSLRNSVSQEEGIRLALTAGDDYELCFTVPVEKEAALAELPVSFTRIGIIEAQSELRLLDENNLSYPMEHNGFDHFRK